VNGVARTKFEAKVAKVGVILSFCLVAVSKLKCKLQKRSAAKCGEEKENQK
jgi:hypothetical protein